MQVRRDIELETWRTALSVPRLWWKRAATRRALHRLQARDLEDVGLTERDRRHECAKWFWQE
jgi:uncharacterized protein YjiS (DUF1127 family)